MSEAAFHQIELDCGRRLAWSEYGDPDGRPMVALHGSPSSRLEWSWADEVGRARHLRVIAPDRPGHGRSDPLPGFTLLGRSDDVAALADHLGIDSFGVIGHSGGGPYALACAVTMPQRTEVVIAGSCAGRMEVPGAYAGMSLTDRQLTWLAMRTPRAGRLAFGGIGLMGRTVPNLPWRLWNDELKEADRAILAALGQPRDAMRAFVEAFRPGGRGVIRDYQVLTQPWGFDPADVPGQVWLWHGDADTTVPLHQSEDLARHIPLARYRLVPGAGHLFVHTHFERILAAAGW